MQEIGLKIGNYLLVTLILALISVASPVHAASKASVEKQFQRWVSKTLWKDATTNGVSSKTFKKVMSGIKINWKLPDLVMPGSKPISTRVQQQAEFRSPAPYFSEKRIRSLVASGRKLAARHKKLLSRIEKKYGVPGRIILAIWGRESGFGRAKIPHNAIQVLATKAFMSTRKPLFHKEILAALVMIEKGYVTRASMKSSWAGALGQPQFLPSSFLEYAVDFDGDGKRNIWTSVPDTLASIANYLNKYGWQRGRDWGFESKVPASISCALEGPDQMRDVSAWAKSGVTRYSGKAFPKSELKRKAALLVPAGLSGPAFIATPNFYVIKSYNNSDLYALFIGNVADRIAYGNRPFQARWKKISGLKRGQVMTMQKRLIKLGHDVGGADGLAGFKTRRAIGVWQSNNKRKPTCFPSSSLAKVLR
ncbi:MAG: lytic murein transglycosylase [Rhizobiaceae bacterium]|nr:lytic murein transglycosylase [Rhizobiaceae bacterium]